MKECCKCKQFKNLTDFGNDRSRKDGKCCYCLLCARKRDADYYQKNHVSRYAQYANHKKIIVEENSFHILNYLKTHPCVDCGERDVLVLEFDHLRDKIRSISSMVNRGVSWKNLLREIEKCEVRCSNCHARKTARQQNWFKFIHAGNLADNKDS